MWIFRTSLLLAFAGCNWAYSLDATSVGVDSDGDGIYDGTDNCPAIANADQLDSNEIDDGGDACAQCPFFIGIDLDADLYDDGCDRCFGPGPNGMDVDGDGIDDGCDPCIAGTSAFPIDFNENGIGDGCEVCFLDAIGDSDQDGLDDACDRCIGGPPHDEDGDGVEDACDNCPLDPNPDQEGLPSMGTACRREIAKAERPLFDPFLVRDPFRWSGVLGVWAVAGDQITLSGIGERRVTYRVDSEFRILVRARLPQPDSHFGIEIVSNTKTDICTVSRATNTLTYAGMPAMGVSPGSDPFTLELYYSNAQFGSPGACVFIQGTTTVQISSTGYGAEARIRLLGNSVEIPAFDLVAAAPLSTTN